MSVPYLKEAAAAGEMEKLIRFVRLHLGDGNEEVGRKEIDKSWIEALKILLRYEPVDESLIGSVLERDESTLALLYFHLHFCLIRKSAEWIQGLWEPINERYPGSMILCAAAPVGQTAGRSTADLDQFLWRARPKRPSARCLSSIWRIPVPPRALAIAP
jgi:hypothetical protein